VCQTQHSTQNKDGDNKNQQQRPLNQSLRFTAALTFIAALMERQAPKIAFMIGCSCTHTTTHTFSSAIITPSEAVKAKIQAKNNKLEIA